MSYALNPIKPVEVLDPVVNINSEKEYAILKGGAEVSWKQIPASSASNNSASFSCPPPSPGIIVSRKCYISMPLTINFTGTVTDPLVSGLLQPGRDAFRAFPIASVTNTLSVSINNTTVSINLSDLISGLERINTSELTREFDYSTFPSECDQFQNYSDAFGTARNPLAQYDDYAYGVSRGGFPYTTMVNTPTTAQVVSTICEPVWLNPFYFGHGQSAGFFGVQNMDFTWNFGDLTRLWSHASGGTATITSVSVTLGVPSMLFQYITPRELQYRPKRSLYPYFNIDRYVNDTSSVVLSNGSVNITSSNIQLNTIPRKIMIYARQKNGLLTYADSDVFMKINSISLNWENRAGLLSGATTFDLYQMSLKNHVNMSWEQWSGGPVFTPQLTTPIKKGLVGSVLCIEFGTDIGLLDTQSAGQLGTFQLSYTINLTNINQSVPVAPASPLIPSLYTVVVSEGVFEILENRSVSMLGVVSKQDVLDARMMPSISYKDIEDVNGGNFLSNLKEFGSDVGRAIKTAAPYVREAAETAIPYVSTGVKLAKAFSGGARRKRGGAYIGGCDYCEHGCERCGDGGAYIGGDLIAGGRVMSRKQLKRRLMD